MQSIELTRPITTEALLKEFESRFNQTMDLSKFTVEELEDVANKIRTKIHEITNNTHFGEELKNHDYQKSQMMLDVVNQQIKEFIPAVAAVGGRLAGGMAAKAGAGKIGQAAATGAGQGAGQAIGQMAHDKVIAPVQQKLAKGLSLGPDEKKIASKMMSDKNVKEGVEEQSELILAAKDMMDKVTGYLEDLATMKTESMLELADKIRDEMGAEKSDAFLNKVKPAIEQAETTLGQTRVELDNSVRILTGEEVATDTMGSDDTMNTGDDADMDLGLDDDDAEADEFGAADAEAGGTDPEGREQRESKEVFEQSNRVYSKLARK